MPERKTLSKLSQIIHDEIISHGAISFARFMETALYCPQIGFYERKRDTIGRIGHFYTNVSPGPLFGELLAYRFSGWLEEMRDSACVRLRRDTAERRLQIVEVGAHDGQLAADILRWLRARRPQLFADLKYLILEPSKTRRAWQQETLREFSPHVRWPDHQLSTINHQFKGVIFSNELLDAFPVHRLGWDAGVKRWFEWGVTFVGGKFDWVRLDVPPPSSIFHPPSSPDLLEMLPDGYTIEVSPAAENWWRAAARSLAVGKLVTIDYGHTAGEVFRPERREGTLRAYHRHQVSGNLLANVGEQDLTAHVNFTAIQQTGEQVGLRTEGLYPQAKFLTQIAGQAWEKPPAFGEWTSDQTRQFQTLIHPEHLGRAFQVLVQSR